MVSLTGLFTVNFSITLLVVSLGDIATSLHTSRNILTWAITGPMLAFGVMGPAFGKAGDLWGHKRLYLVGLGGAGIFAAATAVAWNAGSMIAFRTLSASLGAALGPATMAVINRIFPPRERVKALGYWSMVAAGAPVLGVVAGGPLVDSVGWRVIFAVQAPLCLVGFVLAWVMLPETPRGRRARFDIAGALWLSLGVTSLLLAVNRGAATGWTRPPVLLAFALAPLALAAFVRAERRAPEPLVPLAWLQRPNIVYPVLSQSLMNFAYLGGFLLTPQLLEEVLGYSTTRAGILVIWRPLSFAVSAAMAGMIVRSIGVRGTGLAGGAFVVASMVTFVFVGTTTSAWVVAVGLMLSGVGIGISSPAMVATVAAEVDAADLGVAAALQQLMNQVGAVVGSLLMQTVQVTFAGADGRFAARGFHFAYALGVVFALASVAAAVFIRPVSGETRRAYRRTTRLAT